MAKVARALKILIHPDIDGPEFEKMREQGHTVDRMDSPTGRACLQHEYDRIYGPNCYRMFGPLLKFLPVSIKDARMEVYGPPTKKEPTEKKPRKPKKKKGDEDAEEVAGGLEGVQGTVRF